jgi:hypothetical protein
MIRNIQIVVAEDPEGKLSVLHLSKNRSAALEAFRAAYRGEYRCILHYRNERLAARKFPLKRPLVHLSDDPPPAAAAHAAAARPAADDLPLGVPGPAGVAPAKPAAKRSA